MTTTPDSTSTAEQPGTPPRRRGLVALVMDVIDDIQLLFTQQIELAKAELKESARQAGKGIGLLAAAGVLALFAFGLLLVGLVYVLNVIGLPLWASYLIMAGLLFLVTAILALLGKKHFDKVRGPERTQQSVTETIAELKEVTGTGDDISLDDELNQPKL